jgi:hypothetical protein
VRRFGAFGSPVPGVPAIGAGAAFGRVGRTASRLALGTLGFQPRDRYTSSWLELMA